MNKQLNTKPLMAFHNVFGTDIQGVKKRMFEVSHDYFIDIDKVISTSIVQAATDDEPEAVNLIITVEGGQQFTVAFRERLGAELFLADMQMFGKWLIARWKSEEEINSK